MWGVIYLFVAYSGGVLMFIHRFRRSLEVMQLFPLQVSRAALQSIPPHLHLFLRNTVFSVSDP